MERILLEYKRWANSLTLQELAQTTHDELIKERQTNFQNILRTLNHIYVVDDIFKAHIEGRMHSYTSRNTAHTPSLDQLAHMISEMDNWYLAWYNNLPREKLQDVLTFKFVGTEETGQMTFQEIILHLVNHATYHRGFISDMLYQIPIRPSSNDLPVFIRDIWSKTSRPS
jgi:uncharacterized damage-inducible protein DinB